MYADGDPIGELPVRVRALRGAVTVLVPPSSDEHSPFAGSPPLPGPPTAHASPSAETLSAEARDGAD
jgi:hypothetical protein